MSQVPRKSPATVPEYPQARGNDEAMTPTATARARRLNAFRVASTENAKELVADVLRHLGNLERYDQAHGEGGRHRARRPADRKIFQQQVEAVVCDLVLHHIAEPGSWLCVSRSKATLGKQDRYKPAFVTEKLVCVLDMLARPEMCKRAT